MDKIVSVVMLLIGAMVIGLFLSFLLGADALVTESSSTKHSRQSSDYEYLHRTILGSSKEEDEFTSSPSERWARRLALLVARMDADADGFVARDELKAWIMGCLRRRVHDRAAYRFERLDKDGDNMITWEEVYSDMFGADDEHQEYYLNKEEEEQSLVGTEEMFEAADGNKDGKLDSDEFVQFDAPYDFPHLFDLLLKQGIRSYDFNKDGKIDFQEWKTEQPQYSQVELQAWRQEFDLDFDKDGDGFLTGAEVVSWLYPSNEEVAELEVAYLFGLSDEDGDGRLSDQEIDDHYYNFEKATGFGKRLPNFDRFIEEL